MGGTTSRLRQRVRLTHFLPREQALRRCVNESWSRLGVLIAPRDPLPGPLPCGTSPALFLSWDNLCPFTQRLTTAFSTQAHVQVPLSGERGYPCHPHWLFSCAVSYLGSSLCFCVSFLSFFLSTYIY